MYKLTRKGLWAHKVRFALTGLAVVLGVAFMAGTMILTDTMGKTFDGLFATSNEGIDVVVHRTTGVDSAGGIDVQERVDASLVDAINEVDGVDIAAGSIEGFAEVIKPDGTPLHTGDGVGGTIGASVTYLSLGEFIITDSNSPEERGRFRSYEYAVTAGYATLATDELGIGMNLRFIHSALSPIGTEQEQGSGITSTVSVDLAALWRPEILKDLSIGLNLSNIGPKVRNFRLPNCGFS